MACLLSSQTILTLLIEERGFPLTISKDLRTPAAVQKTVLLTHTKLFNGLGVTPIQRKTKIKVEFTRIIQSCVQG